MTLLPPCVPTALWGRQWLPAVPSPSPAQLLTSSNSWVSNSLSYKTDLPPALSQGKLSYWVCGASGRLRAQWLQALLHSAPCVIRWGFVYRHRQLTDCVSRLQPLGLGERLAGWGSPVWGLSWLWCRACGSVSLASLTTPAKRPFLRSCRTGCTAVVH